MGIWFILVDCSIEGLKSVSFILDQEHYVLFCGHGILILGKLNSYMYIYINNVMHGSIPSVTIPLPQGNPQDKVSLCGPGVGNLASQLVPGVGGGDNLNI